MRFDSETPLKQFSNLILSIKKKSSRLRFLREIRFRQAPSLPIVSLDKKLFESAKRNFDKTDPPVRWHPSLKLIFKNLFLSFQPLGVRLKKLQPCAAGIAKQRPN